MGGSDVRVRCRLPFLALRTRRRKVPAQRRIRGLTWLCGPRFRPKAPEGMRLRKIDRNPEPPPW